MSKKLTTKEQALRHVEMHGNEMRRTDILKFVFELKPNRKFDSKRDRGFYSCAFCKGYGGHFIQGGNAELRKNKNGSYSVWRKSFNGSYIKTDQYNISTRGTSEHGKLTKDNYHLEAMTFDGKKIINSIIEQRKEKIESISEKGSKLYDIIIEQYHPESLPQSQTYSTQAKVEMFKNIEFVDVKTYIKKFGVNSDRVNLFIRSFNVYINGGSLELKTRLSQLPALNDAEFKYASSKANEMGWKLETYRDEYDTIVYKLIPNNI